MPWYCYTTDNGHKTERWYRMGKAPARVWIKGRRAFRDFYAEQCKVPPPSNYPRESDAAGVHPDQVKEAAAADKKMGVPTEYNRETGNPIFTSRTHERKFLQAHGLYHRNAGYGDAAPRNR